MPRVVPTAGVDFDRIMPNGAIGWRARCDADNIFINCLDYSRWGEVWPSARGLMNDILAAGLASPQALVGVTLQYVDMFNWNGDISSYSSDQLLQSGSDFIPPNIMKQGPVWHLHQGWFEDGGGDIPGRLLNRVHFDSIEDKGLKVKLDTVLRKDFATPFVFRQLEGGDNIDVLFDWMHEKNKMLLRSVLAGEVLDAIGLG
jgi:hypothetical protein